MLEMLSNPYREGDFFLGRMMLGRFGLLRACGIRPRGGQAVTVGMPGSGKSTAAAIPNVLLHSGPVICFDPKGEIAQRCHAARGSGDPSNGVKGRGDEVYIVDPTNRTGLPKSRYNLLAEIAKEKNPDDAIRMIYNGCEGIVKDQGGENSWVSDGARAAAVGLMPYVITEFPPEQRNLVTLRRLLVEGDRAGYDELLAEARKRGGDEAVAAFRKQNTPFDLLLQKMIHARDENPFRHLIAGAASTLKKMGDRQRGSILSALIEATAWLDLPQYQNAVSGCDFMLSDFQTKHISLFIVQPLNELTGVAGGFMRMFLTIFTDQMYRAAAPPKAGTVLCMVDEFPQFGYIPRFCAIGPTMRSYGVKLWLLCQDFGQLKAIYPKEWEGFLGCAAIVQYMAVKHGETIDYLVKSLGEKLVRDRTPDGRMIERPVPLLDREQAMRFLEVDTGNQIIWRGDRRPLKLKTAPFFWYFKSDRYTPDPLYPEPKLRAWFRRRAARKQIAGDTRRLTLGRLAASACVFGLVVFTLVLLAMATSCGHARHRSHDAFLTMPEHTNALVEAVKRHDLKEADRLGWVWLEKHDEIDYAVKVAIDRNDADMADMLFSFTYQFPFMAYAARTGHMAICEKLVFHRSIWWGKDRYHWTWRASEAQFRKDVVRYCGGGE